MNLMRMIFIVLSVGFFLVSTAQAQSNTFPTSGKVGIGTTAPETLLHMGSSATAPTYPSSTSRGDIFTLMEANNNGMEFGVAKGNNTRRAWILARHTSTTDYGRFYATLHLQPALDDVSQYRGVAIGYPASTNLPLQVALAINGNVGIGTTSPQAKLAVDGNILAKEIKIKTDISVPDYVFESDYELLGLAEVEAYVKEHKHLPEIPSAADINRDGLDLAEMNLLLLKKVEELTLYILQQSEEISVMGKRLEKAEEYIRFND